MAFEQLSDVARAHGSESDPDIGVLLGRGAITLDEELAIASALQAVLRDRELDLVVLDRADPLLLHRVATEGQLIWGSTRRFQEWKMYAYRRYQDHRPYLDMEQNFIRPILFASTLRSAPPLPRSHDSSATSRIIWRPSKTGTTKAEHGLCGIGEVP